MESAYPGSYIIRTLDPPLHIKVSSLRVKGRVKRFPGSYAGFTAKSLTKSYVASSQTPSKRQLLMVNANQIKEA